MGEIGAVRQVRGGEGVGGKVGGSSIEVGKGGRVGRESHSPPGKAKEEQEGC